MTFSPISHIGLSSALITYYSLGDMCSKYMVKYGVMNQLVKYHFSSDVETALLVVA
jgi:hypothetical protein